MDIKNKKSSIESKDIDQIKKYMSTKGFNLLKEDNESKYIYTTEDSYALRNSLVIEGSDIFKVMNYKKFQHEIYKPIKETIGKMIYEVDWEFIQSIAERMASNKGKYPPFNWMKEMDEEQIEDIKQATIRHFIEFAKGNFADDGREFGHIEAIVCNLMIYLKQIKK